MATSSMEARRRRIVDRGSDRLALITGRIQTLPSSSSTESYHSHTASCPPSISHDHDLSTLLPSNQPIDGYEGKSSSLLHQHDSTSESGEINANQGGSRERPPVLRKCDTISEALRAPSWEVDGRLQTSRVSTVEDSSISPSNTEYHHEPQVHREKFFNPNQLNSAIAATESTRIYCSLAAAIFVVLSCVGFPILGSRIIKSTIFFRPLYLVLLTNVSIVLARLLLDKQKALERTEHEAHDGSSEGGHGWPEQIGKALESGLVLQNIVSSVFMDCGVYATAVICGLSMAQKLGW